MPIWSNRLQAAKGEEMEAVILFSTNVYLLKDITFFLMEYLDKLHRLRVTILPWNVSSNTS